MIQRQLTRLFSLTLVVLFLHGCGQTPQLGVDSELQEQLRRVEHWEAQGKLGIRLPEEAHSANFDWRHTPHGSTLRLSGPFGQGTTWLRREGRLVSLESPDQPLQYARNAEELMESQLGWQVPVSNLSYWIRGVAAPGVKVQGMVRNPGGTLAELHQQGWEITYSRYGSVNGWAVPGKLVAKRGDISLTLVVKRWQLPAQDAIASRP